MSRLRHEIPSNFAERFAWHDVVKIATSPCIRPDHVAIATWSCHAIEAAKRLRISCRKCDIILPLKGTLGAPHVGRQLARPGRPKTATEASAMQAAAWPPKMCRILRSCAAAAQAVPRFVS